MRDYTDACFRYLRSTGMVDISQKGKSLSILPNKKHDVKYFLDNVDRNPVYIDEDQNYKTYLFDSTIPALYTDNRVALTKKIIEHTELPISTIKKLDINKLKEILIDAIEEKKQGIINEQISDIKDYKQFNDIMDTFEDIEKRNVLDIPLMFEWNTWRAMTMLDGGQIIANLNFDDNGVPMSTAQGNMADIFCNYDDYNLTVEVTTAGGAKQYEMESEPVSRHLAKYKKETGKDAFCLFIAPKINQACIAHFFVLHKVNVSFYGGKSVVMPIELQTFKKMLTDSCKANYKPSPLQLKSLFEFSIRTANEVTDEAEWYGKLTEKALNWLAD